jgi:hypothetical protein
VRQDCAGDRSRRKRVVDTVCIGLRERAEYRGTIVDAIRPVEQRRIARC